MADKKPAQKKATKRKAVKRSAGRPTAYTNKLSDAILKRMACGESVASICRDPKMPTRSTVMLWAASDREGFSDRYAKAVEARALHWADEILDIADDSRNDWMEREDPDNPGFNLMGENIQRARLRVDTRKWLLSKMLPQYADKQKLDHTSSDGSMTPKSNIDASKLSDAALKELLAAKTTDEPK